MSPTLQSLIAYSSLCRAEASGSPPPPIHLLTSIGVWTNRQSAQVWTVTLVKLYGVASDFTRRHTLTCYECCDLCWNENAILSWEKHWFPDQSPLRVLDGLLYFVGRMFPPLNSAATIKMGGRLREGDLFCVEHITPGVSTMFFSSSLILLCNG